MAIKYKPDYLEAYYNVGNAYFEIENYNIAIRYIKKTAQLGSEHKSNAIACQAGRNKNILLAYQQPQNKVYFCRNFE